jgi:hypothetical protein
MDQPFVIKGGPPPPMRFCTRCGEPLTGKPEHRMKGELLFCDEVCEELYFAARLSAQTPTPA